MDSNNHIADSQVQQTEHNPTAGVSPSAQPIQQEATIPVNEVESWLRQQLIPYSSRVEKLEETERLKDAKILALESALSTLKTQLEVAIKHKSTGLAAVVENAGKLRNPNHPIAGTSNPSVIRPSTTGGKRPSVAQHTDITTKEEPKTIKPVVAVAKHVTGSPQVGKETKAHSSITSTPVKKDKDSEKKETKGGQAEEDKKGLKENKSVLADKKPIVKPATATTETKNNKKADVEKKGIKTEEKKTTESTINNAGEKKHAVAATAAGDAKKRETALKDANKDVKDASNEGNKKEKDLTKDKAATHVTATAAKYANRKDLVTASNSFNTPKKTMKEGIAGKSAKIDDKKNAIPVKTHKDSGKENTETKKEEEKNKKKQDNDDAKKQETVETKQAEKTTELNGAIVPTAAADDEKAAVEPVAAAVEVIEKDSAEENIESKSTQLEVISEPSSGDNTTNPQLTQEVLQTQLPVAAV